MADQELLAVVRDLLAEAGISLDAIIATAVEEATGAPAGSSPLRQQPVSDAGICTRCKTRPVRKAGAYLCASCKAEVKGRPASTGYVASRIRAGKTEREAKQAASRAFAEGVVAALTGVPAPKRAGKHAVTTTPEVMRAVNEVQRALTGAKTLPGEVAPRDASFDEHTVTLTFDSAARAKAFAEATA